MKFLNKMMRTSKTKSEIETKVNPMIVPALKAVLKANPKDYLAQIVVL